MGYANRHRHVNFVAVVPYSVVGVFAAPAHGVFKNFIGVFFAYSSKTLNKWGVLKN